MATVEVEIDGGRDARALARRLREAAKRGLDRAINRQLRPEARVVAKDIRTEARTTLPRRGGLARRVARSRIRTTVRGPVLEVLVRGDLDLGGIDAGLVRHPTFGHEPIQAQLVRPGYFTRSINDAVPELAEAIERAMDEVGRQIDS